LEKAKKRDDKKPKTRFPKWLFWLVAFAMLFNVLALFPQTLSITVIEFLKTSAKLSADDDIQNYKKSIVVVETSDSRGTGFSIDSQGHIMTNNHVVEDERSEEHTSELQSRFDLVCRLLLEKKKRII